MSSPWIIKYQPNSSKDIFGQDKQIALIKNFIQNYKSQKKKGMIVYGASGSGKTSIVHALGKEMNYEVIEVNASDFRNKDKINATLGNASKQMSLFAKSKIILVDEIEGLSGTKDRGGLLAVTKIFEKSSFPVIMTAVNPYDQKFSTLRKKTELLELNQLGYTDIFANLKKIADSENLEYDEMAIKSLARRSGGDMRAAINDLQSISGDGKISKEDLNDLSEREQTETIESALVKIFKSTDANIAGHALDNINEDFGKVFMWIDENLPKEYSKPQDLARAYNWISKADVYNGRIRKWQHWRFMVYISALLSAGVATAKDERYKVMANYEQSKRPLHIWMANMKYMKRKSIAEKISLGTHASKKQVLQESLPFIQAMIKNDRNMASEIAEEFELDNAEISWLKK